MNAGLRFARYSGTAEGRGLNVRTLGHCPAEAF
jgi:hypothetical protein